MSVDSLRSKNTLKQGKFLKFLNVTTKPKVLENLKRSWKKSWNLKSSKEYEPCWCLKEENGGHVGVSNQSSGN